MMTLSRRGLLSFLGAAPIVATQAASSLPSGWSRFVPSLKPRWNWGTALTPAEVKKLLAKQARQRHWLEYGAESDAADIEYLKYLKANNWILRDLKGTNIDSPLDCFFKPTDDPFNIGVGTLRCDFDSVERWVEHYPQWWEAVKDTPKWRAYHRHILKMSEQQQSEEGWRLTHGRSRDPLWFWAVNGLETIPVDEAARFSKRA